MYLMLLKSQNVLLNIQRFNNNLNVIYNISLFLKNSEGGIKTVWYGQKVWIDLADAETIKEGEMVTFMDWGNLQILKINKKGSTIESIDANLSLDNKNF